MQLGYQKSPSLPAFQSIGLLLIWLMCVPTSRAAQIPATNRLAILVSGLSGNHEFKIYFQNAMGELRQTLLRKGYQREELVLFSEEHAPDSLWQQSRLATRKNLREFFGKLKGRSQPYSEVFIFIVGHANGHDEEAILHLPGEDMSYAELMNAIDPIPAQQMTVVVAAPQGEAWIQKLSRPQRVVIAGNGYRQYDFIPLLFLRTFPLTLEKAGILKKDSEADVDSPRSLFDVFLETQQKVLAWYKRNNLQVTEMALLDADGDKKGDSFIKEGAPVLKEIALAHSSDARAAALILFSDQGGSYGKH